MEELVCSRWPLSLALRLVSSRARCLVPPPWLQVAQAEADLHAVLEERNTLVNAKDQAVREAVELRDAVQALKLEVAEARQAGTPHGEGAKVVSRL